MKRNTQALITPQKMVNMQDKAALNHWLQHWGVYIQQLRAAVRNTNNHQLKVIREELKSKGVV